MEEINHSVTHPIEEKTTQSLTKKLLCVNKKCFHSWEYKGKITDDKGLISCPKCHYRHQLKSLTHSPN